MKKTGLIVCIVTLILAMVLGTFAMAFADEEEGGEFTLVETYPEDGQKNAAIENLGIKLTFSKPVNLEANQAANNQCFKITGPDGDLPIKVYYNPDIPEQVLVLKYSEEATTATVRSSEEYTVSISGNFKDNEGNTLGEDKTIKFKTTDLRRNNIVYFVLMGVMMFGMVFFSRRQAQTQAAENGDQAAGGVEPFNPYKEAKRTGKPIAQVIAEHDKEVAKQAAIEAKRIAREEAEEEEEEETPSGNYRVKGPRPISAAGSTYITGRKAAAEAKAAEEERLAKRRAKNKKK